MSKVTTMEILFSCDGGNCKERFSHIENVTSINTLEIEGNARVEVKKRGWVHSGGCHYCPECNKRIFG